MTPISAQVDGQHSLESSEGTLLDRYEIYVSCASKMGWCIKSFNEWLNS